MALIYRIARVGHEHIRECVWVAKTSLHFQALVHISSAVTATYLVISAMQIGQFNCVPLGVVVRTSSSSG